MKKEKKVKQEKMNNSKSKNGNSDKEKILRKRKGIVVSAKNDKTIVVAVESFKTHPKYLKKYKSTKKYHVHDENNEYKEGDRVEFIVSRPYSKKKKFKVLKSK